MSDDNIAYNKCYPIIAFIQASEEDMGKFEQEFAQERDSLSLIKSGWIEEHFVPK